MKKLKKLLKNLFGKKFNIWDIIIILSVVPYMYLTYMGIEYTSGFKAIYQKVVIVPFSFYFIGKYLITPITKRQTR